MTLRATPKEHPRPEAGAPRAPLWHRLVAGTLKTVVPLALLAAAGWGYREITATPPVPERREEARIPRLVEVVPALPARQGPLIEAWGEVVAARVLSLRAEVPGAVTGLSPELRAGGEVLEGEFLFAVDDRELRLAVAEAEARIAQIDARIAIERGQAARAAKDLERGAITLTPEQRSLVLREPQMAELEGERAAAVAARDRAIVARDRAVTRAPFDAVVIDETIAPGKMLMAGTETATLAATDVFELRLAVPVTALEWIDLGAGQEVRLTQPGVWREGAFRTGTILRRAAELGEGGRMAGIIVGVPDPLARSAPPGTPPLLIGSFLRAEIEGRAVEGAVRLPRRLLRAGDTVWVMDAADRLDIRPVEVAWRGADSVLVASGLAAGDRIVTTDLAVVAEGMELRLPDPPATAEPAPAPATASGKG